MPVTRRTEPMTDEDRATARGVYSGYLGGPGCLAYLLVVLFSLIGLMVVALPSAAVFPTAPPALAILADLVGLMAIQLIVIHIARIPRKRRHKEESARRLEAALARGTVLVIEMEADAAWSDLGPNDDSNAVLLRVGPGRFVYVNDSWLNDLPTFDKSEGKRFPARVTLRMLDETIEARASLSVHDGGGEIEVREDILALPDYEKGGYPPILTKDEHYGTRFLELADSDLPTSWRAVTARP